MPKLTLGDLRSLMQKYKPAENEDLDPPSVLLREIVETDLAQEDDSLVLYDGNPDNPEQKNMMTFYEIVFTKFENSFEKGHNILLSTAPNDRLFVELHNWLDMKLPYHPPLQLEKTMAHFQENMRENKENRVIYRGDSRPPEEVFGLAESEQPGFKVRATGENVLDTPVVSDEENFICCSKNFRSAAAFPTDIEKEPDTWIYVVIPEGYYDVHKHAKTFLPSTFRTDETKYNYIQNRLFGYEVITNDIPPERIVAAIRVSREPSANLLHESPKFMIGEIQYNPNCEIPSGQKQQVMQQLENLKKENEAVWEKLSEETNQNLTPKEYKAIHTTSIQEAYKYSEDSSSKYHRRRRSMVGQFFTHEPEKELEQKTKEVEKAKSETQEELLDRLYQIAKRGT